MLNIGYHAPRASAQFGQTTARRAIGSTSRGALTQASSCQVISPPARADREAAINPDPLRLKLQTLSEQLSKKMLRLPLDWYRFLKPLYLFANFRTSTSRLLTQAIEELPLAVRNFNSDAMYICPILLSHSLNKHQIRIVDSRLLPAFRELAEACLPQDTESGDELRGCIKSLKRYREFRQDIEEIEKIIENKMV